MNQKKAKALKRLSFVKPVPNRVVFLGETRIWMPGCQKDVYHGLKRAYRRGLIGTDHRDRKGA